jgi:hypothetical protein
MARSEVLGETKWRQSLNDRTSFSLFVCNRQVAEACGLEDGQKRKLRVTLSDGSVLAQQFFAITSGKEVAFNKNSQAEIEDLIEVLDCF